MPKLYIVRGIPGSGKSTAARAIVEKDPTHTVRFNWDDLRNMMGPYWVPEREDTKILEDLKDTFMKRMMLKGWNIVSDNMNLNPKETDWYKELVNNFNSTHSSEQHYEIEYVNCFTSVEACIRRDALRPNPIGADIIRMMWNKYRSMAQIIICAIENKRVYERVKPLNTNLKKAIVFDLDATLAFNLTGRPYWGPGCAEGIIMDSPNIPIINMLKAYNNAGYYIIVVTGREGTDEVKNATSDWFTKYEIPVDEVNWRPVGDKRKGQDYKLEVMNKLSSQYNIELVVDDSQKIVDVLRENGYTVLQPNEGKF